MAAAAPVPVDGRAVTTYPRARELFLAAGTGDYYERAKQDGRTLTAWLEAQDPSAEYNDGLDAFERQLMMANIRTTSDGHTYFADEMDAWKRDANTKALFPEWARRQWQRGLDRRLSRRDNAYTSTDYAENTIQRPYTDDTTIRFTEIEPAVPLSELIARTVPIMGNLYKSVRFVDSTAQKRMTRVAEGAPLRRVKLLSAENTLRFGKFGLLIEETYEQIRRMRIDSMALHIRLMSIQTEVDQVAAVIDTIVNGDGNAGTSATVYALTTLDPDAVIANGLTARAWLAFKQKFTNPYAMTTALMRPGIELDLRLLDLGTANVHVVALANQAMLGTLTTINDRLASGIRVGVTDDAPADAIVGLDARFAVERVVEIGSDISEMTRWIENQTQLTTFSINEGFGRLQLGPTTAVLDLTA